MTLTIRRRARAGALAGALLGPLLATGLLAPSASALATDSLVYLQGGQVWVAHADGTGAHQFTSSANNWVSPSMDDAGNVVVVGGQARVNADGSDSDGSSEIYRFAPDGHQVGVPIPTWGSRSTPACPTYGPLSARVAPDGSKVAYGIFDCGALSNTALWTPITSTGLSFPNQNLGQEDFYQPQWVDSSQFVVSHVGTQVTDSAARWFVHPTAGADYTGSGWSDSSVTGGGAQAVISRQGTTMIVFEDDGSSWLDGKPRNVRMHIWSSPSLAAALVGSWADDCVVNLNASVTSDPQHLSPSFASDGASVYWGDDAGVEMAQVADRSNGCANVVASLVVPGGRQPFVSPAPLPPGIGAGGGGGGGGGQPPTQQLPPVAAFRVGTSHAVVGHKVRFTGASSTAGSAAIVKYAWRFGDGKRGTGRVVRHAFHKVGKYRVRLVVTDANGKTSTVKHTVRVRRH